MKKTIPYPVAILSVLPILPILSILFILLSAALLTGCGIYSTNRTDSSDQEDTFGETEDGADAAEQDGGAGNKDSADKSDKSFSHAEKSRFPDNSFVFPEAKPFQDDTGKNIQRDENYLFCYDKGKLIRYHQDSFEPLLLYETGSEHALHFCLYGDFVYFVDRTTATSLEGRETMLYRIDKDGKNLTLLQNHILNVAYLKDDTYGSYKREHYSEGICYDIDVYDDMIYLLYGCYGYFGGKGSYRTCNLYYRIQPDGSVTEAEESETLYGQLPADIFTTNYSGAISLPYAMRNYGYVFVINPSHILCRLDLETGAYESLDINMDNYNVTFSHSSILLKNWQELSLLHLSDGSTDTIKKDGKNLNVSVSAPSSDGESFFCLCSIYDDNSEQNIYSLNRIMKDGTMQTLISDFNPDAENAFSPDSYYYDNDVLFTDNFLYYTENAPDFYQLMRIPLAERPVPEKINAFSAYAASSPASFVREHLEKEKAGEYASLTYSVDKIKLSGNTDADLQINQALSEVYHSFEESMATETENVEENAEYYEDADYMDNYFSLSASCNYMDENVISFCFSYYQYYDMAAHGYYWDDYYVFDRKNGKRLTLEDVTGMPSASVIKIARPYVEQVAGWENLFESEYFPPEVLVEPTRFSLSDDGYTLYFAPYELDCYAAGSFLITIPFEAFEKEL